MTVIAYILMNVEMQEQNRVLEAVKKLEPTREIYMIYGAFDIILKAEFTDNNHLGTFVVDELKSLEGVLETQTNVCATDL